MLVSLLDEGTKTIDLLQVHRDNGHSSQPLTHRLCARHLGLTAETSPHARGFQKAFTYLAGMSSVSSLAPSSDH